MLEADGSNITDCIQGDLVRNLLHLNRRRVGELDAFDANG